MSGQADHAERFLALHNGEEPLLLPNPWDPGSAKLLASLGFQALATTSGERVAAAAEVAHGGRSRLVLTARAENHLHGVTDLADTITRLQAYQEAGADVLYAPGGLQAARSAFTNSPVRTRTLGYDVPELLQPQPWIFSPRSSMAMNFRSLRTRVSGFFASSSR
jgi:2-methylisocitrate lyase-like PEP mutase family enzyme